MPVEAVILDLDGTLIETTSARPQRGVPEMLDSLREAGLGIAVASNRPAAQQRLAAAGIGYDALLTQQRVGSTKGTPAWVQLAASYFGVQRFRLLWLGDGDTDMWSAVNGRVIYVNAGWSAPQYPYG